MPRRAIRTKKTRGERRTLRRSLGCLRDALVAPKTVRRYCAAVEKFLDFIAWSKLPLHRTTAALDHTVCMHTESLWAEGDGKNWAADCLSGLRHYIPATRNSLRGDFMPLGHGPSYRGGHLP
jgi:hypothetical protein